MVLLEQGWPPVTPKEPFRSDFYGKQNFKRYKYFLKSKLKIAFMLRNFNINSIFFKIVFLGNCTAFKAMPSLPSSVLKIP